MLTKLYKHEFTALLRWLLPMWAAVVGLAAISKLVISIPVDSVYYSIISGSFGLFYTLSIFATFGVGFALIVVRFYKNLYGAEGYLTFSLPFTAAQHILCKLLCGAVMLIGSFIVTLFSLTVMNIGTFDWTEVSNVIHEMWFSITGVASAWHIAGYSLELLLIVIAAVFEELLMIYAAISIGQTFKNRIGGAVIVYVIIYAILQSFGVVVIIFSIIFSSVFKDVTLSPTGLCILVHVTLILLLIKSVGFGMIYFFLNKRFAEKKLNLE